MSRPKKEASVQAQSVVAVPQVALKKSLQTPGLFDVLTETQAYLDLVLKKFKDASRIYGFQHLEVPPIEQAQVFKQYYSSGNKMLNSLVEFESSGKNLAFRPEMLPGVLRAYAQHKVSELHPSSKWMYFGAILSLSPKQQFVQDYSLGVEIFGTFNHLSEAQTVSAFWHMFAALGLEPLTLEINHVGTTSCQDSYQQALSSYLASKKYDLCDSCIESLQGRSMDVLRCANLDCQTVLSEAPSILDFLEDPSRKHFTSILEALDELEIPYQLNPYYAGSEGMGRTNCRITYQPRESNSKIVLAEGGYHDQLMQRISGKAWGSFGMQASLASITKALELGSILVEREHTSEVCLVPLGDLAAKRALRLFRDLTREKVSVYDQFGDTGVKNQLKLAESFKTPIALIMGQKEALDETVILRDVKSGMQGMFSYDKIIDEVKKRLGK